MHFENVQLPSSVIAELYKQSLVVLEDVQPVNKNERVNTRIVLPEPLVLKVAKEEIDYAKEENESMPWPIATQTLPETLNPGDNKTVTAPFKYLGGFEKQVAIVVAEHYHPNIGDEDLAFLSKLLTACKLSLKDVAIINVVSNPNADQLWQLMPPAVMLMFDVDPGTVGLPFRRPHFEVQKWAGARFMNAPDLEKFRIGDEFEVKMLKTKLWLCLQNIFLEK